MMHRLNLVRLAILVISFALLGDSSFAATRKARASKAGRTAKASQVRAAKKAVTARAAVKKGRTVKKATLRSVKATRKGRGAAKTRVARARRGTGGYVGGVVAGGPWLTPTYADSTVGDHVDGEDLVVRRAAVEALGPLNGSVVVVDPTSGRVLSMVNQKLALGNGFQPCSTVKVMTAVAGLAEGTVERDSYMRVSHRSGMNLTNALALSNNPYFANIGVKLGYDKINHWGRLLGYGEKAGLNIEGEQPGEWPSAPPANGGMGMMTSFGEGIGQTPLQLAAIMSAVANGGTLLYLQHPKTQAEAEHLVPRIKRQLPIQNLIDDLQPGMAGAVDFGTARRAYYDPQQPIFGKTGTCTDRSSAAHMGWFGSYNEVGGRKLVVVVMLTGGRPVNGPVASGVAGEIYRTLSQKSYFANTRSISPVAIIKGSSW